VVHVVDGRVTQAATKTRTTKPAMETREVTRSDANSDSSNEECGGIDDGKDCDGDEYVVHRRHLRVALYPPDVALGEGVPELLLRILLPRYLVEGVGVECEGVDKPSPSASSLSVGRRTRRSRRRRSLGRRRRRKLWRSRSERRRDAQY